jgi:hypothetical protein
MSYVIHTESGLEIVKDNPIDKLDSVEFSGSEEDCKQYISSIA